MSVWSRSFLLGLLVIVHLQSCVEDVNAVKSCCFNFQIRKIPLNAIIKYENVDRDCPISGVIFTVRTSRVCADPNQSWVQQAMNKIDQRLLKSTEPIPVLNPQPRGPAHIQIHTNMKPKPRRHQKPRVLIQLNPPGSATFKT
uniref:C-C motif chemokine n=1 Tax=Astyanax mexicanus TaxID=7994 RepID=A0A3B1JDA9_ASTMX